jgi:pilus assembly protein CpaF
MSLLQRIEKAQQSAGIQPAGTQPAGTQPAGTQPAGTQPAGTQPAGTQPAGTQPAGTQPAGTQPAGTQPAGAVARVPGSTSQVGSREAYLSSVRLRLLDGVIGASDSLLDETGETDIHTKVQAVVDQIIFANRFTVTRDERWRLIEDVIAEITGFGPLEPLLRDESVTEVMVNGPGQVYAERKGKLELTNVVFRNDEHVMHIIDRIIAPMGRRIDESSPKVDARLPDGSRVNAIIAPLSLVGPVITVRKFSTRPYTVDDLIGFGTATPEMFDFLRACVEVRLNIFVSGGTGSGKTTFLNVLSSFIPNDERIVTVEDAAELQLRQEHVVTLEARPANLEGEGEVPIRLLVRNALHMRPDRIIVGECRGGEALDMLQAMGSGHDGSLSTGHANTPRDMLARIETMVLMAGYELPLRSIREQIASAIDLIVHTARLKDGSRKVVNITEITGIEEDEILTQDIFVFEQTGVRDGKIEGQLKPTGTRPTFMSRFAEGGIQLPAGEFGIPPEDPSRPDRARPGKARFTRGELQPLDPSLLRGRAVRAGGMVYVSSIGPVDPNTGQVVAGGIKEQANQCLRNLEAKLKAEGSSLDKVVWANWSLRDPSEFDAFNKEWVRWFPGEMPVGQGTLMPPLQRRAGFRISLGVIAQA